MRSAPDRILAVALARFGTEGYTASSVRAIANDADVSPALILHHFGSKEGLRQACDDYVFAFFRELLTRAADHQPVEAMARFEGISDEAAPLMRYLMRQAADDSPRANALVAEIVELTKQSMADLTDKGYVKPTDDPDMRAAILVMLRLGPFLLAGAVERATGADVLSPEGLTRMYRSTIELLESGLYTRAGVPHEGALLEKYDQTHVRRQL